MSAYFLIIPIILPILFGLILKIFPIKNDKIRKISSFGVVLLTSIIMWVFLFTIKEDKAILIPFTDSIDFSLKLDGLGKIFAGMVAILWPVALCYSFVYMKHDGRKESYNRFYVMTYGVVLGLACSANLITLYFFYECLTFITLPLIIHYQTEEAKRAGRYYLYFSLSGSSLVLGGLVILAVTTGSTDFLMGGLLTTNSTLLNVAYLLAFFGFGVKAALFPLCYWLPMAGAAPTPTTALLHAVAVVKAGAFAIMRVTYYNWNYELLHNSWAQAIALCFIAFTIVYGSTKALKEQHLKRRFAYSTISNLSYILLGVLLCSKVGLAAALVHFLYHSITKISIFFSCGAIIETNETHYIYELNGMGKKAPIIFTIYTISGLSLIGVPLFAGFISKYYLLSASINEGTVFSYLGLAALIISAILTAIYVLSITVRAFVKEPIKGYEHFYEEAKEPEIGFLITCGIFAVLTVVFGIFSSPILQIIANMIGGGF